MKLLIDISQLHSFRAKQLVPLECEICADTFYKSKNLVLRGLKGTRAVAVCGKKECKKKCLSNRLKNYASNPLKRVTKRMATKRELVNILGGQCYVCGYNRSLTSLIFHHRDPKLKSFSITHGITRKYPKEKLITEIKKCVLLCSNCHGELHDGLIKNTF